MEAQPDSEAEGSEGSRKASVTPKYEEMAKFYARFAKGSDFDFSDNAMHEAFEVETYGRKWDVSNNGYVYGKKMMDVTLASWKQDVEDGLMTKFDILSDYEPETFAFEFVENFLSKVISGRFFPYA